MLAKGVAEAVAVWGRRPVAQRGMAMARRLDLPLLEIEDAFLRSVHPGKRGGPGCGLLVDRRAQHYDATRPSDLECLLAEAELGDPAQLARAEEGIAFLRRHGISKYSNWLPDRAPPAPGYVLVVDQTRGDAALAGAGRRLFAEMLGAARSEHPGTRIVIRTHPVTAAGRRGGHFSDADLDERTEICADPVNPWALLDGARAVYAVSSHLGFEAILAGHRPVLFGQPFYAGWGLSDDRRPVARRTRRLTAAQLFAGAMLDYPLWYDPCLDRLACFEDVARLLAAQARAWREDQRPVVCAGMKPWKHRPVAAFLQGAAPVFVAAPEAALDTARRTGRDLVVWAGKAAPGLDRSADDAQVRLRRMEDGFLRSVGLGADLLPAASLVLDDLGIYFDPTRPSRLEALIAAAERLPPDARARAQALIDAIVRKGLSKYNTGDAPPALPATTAPRILVPGQVEDDASIRLGAGEIRTNLGLLEAARAHFPAAQIIYKPHPDVERGLRDGAVPLDRLDALADVVAHHASPTALLDAVDIVWTMTSLMGFEALLRGREVHCTGSPFYAGWGLTTDHGAPLPRRTARPDIVALAHAALIDYPRYFDAQSGMAASPEVILERLSARSNSVSRQISTPARVLAVLQHRFRALAPLWRRGN